MSSLDIRHLRLHKQHLSTPTLKDPIEVLKSLVAVQAQDYFGAKWALGLRTVGCTDDLVERAFADGRILRLHVMRPTWHFVTPEDIRWLVKLTAPRVNAVSSYYYRKAELDQKVFKQTNKVLTKALQGGRQLTRDDLRLALKRAGIEPGDSMRFGYIMHRSELDSLVCSGARKGNQFTYALLDERAPQSRSLAPDEALGELTHRYFSSRGPATVQDYAWWSGLSISDARRGIEIVGRGLSSEIIDGKTYWLPAASDRAPKRLRRAHLLPSYDEYLIAYKDRSAAMHPEFNHRSIAAKVVFYAPVVIDGQVVGGWKRVLRQDLVTIQIRLFMRLNKTDRESVTIAAKSYADFLAKVGRIEWL